MVVGRTRHDTIEVSLTLVPKSTLLCAGTVRLFRGGYFAIGVWRGIPFRMHWTTPLAALIGGPAFFPFFLASMICHELGHAVLVRRFRYRVLGIDLTPVMGLCRWSGDATAWEHAIIAWGGVLAQGFLVLAGSVVWLSAGWVLPQAQASMAVALAGPFVCLNLIWIAVNLAPIPPLDGAEAWQLLPYLRARTRTLRPRRSRRPRPSTAARQIDELIDRVVDRAKRDAEKSPKK